jgi:hypothetical protein
MKIGCFHCGELDGETYEDDLSRTVCMVCDTRSIVSFQMALDLLREIDIEGNLPQYAEEILDDGTMCEEGD